LGLARGEPRGGCACRQLDWSRWGSVAGTESRKDDAADGAGPQLYAACIGGSWRCSRVLAKAGNVVTKLRAVGWGGCARGCRGWWGLRGASRGPADACRQSYRRRWGSVAGTESLEDDAADVAGPQQYAAFVGWACALRECLRTPAVQGCRCCVLWAEAVVRGAVAGDGFCEGRRSVQTIRSKQMGQRRWHRVS
jgi:hypothetical protein